MSCALVCSCDVVWAGVVVRKKEAFFFVPRVLEDFLELLGISWDPLYTVSVPTRFYLFVRPGSGGEGGGRGPSRQVILQSVNPSVNQAKSSQVKWSRLAGACEKPFWWVTLDSFIHPSNHPANLLRTYLTNNLIYDLTHSRYGVTHRRTRQTRTDLREGETILILLIFISASLPFLQNREILSPLAGIGGFPPVF